MPGMGPGVQLNQLTTKAFLEQVRSLAHTVRCDVCADRDAVHIQTDFEMGSMRLRWITCPTEHHVGAENRRTGEHENALNLVQSVGPVFVMHVPTDGHLDIGDLGSGGHRLCPF
jgi:hypothetical protein